MFGSVSSQWGLFFLAFASSIGVPNFSARALSQFRSENCSWSAIEKWKTQYPCFYSSPSPFISNLVKSRDLKRGCFKGCHLNTPTLIALIVEDQAPKAEKKSGQSKEMQIPSGAAQKAFAFDSLFPQFPHSMGGPYAKVANVSQACQFLENWRFWDGRAGRKCKHNSISYSDVAVMVTPSRSPLREHNFNKVECAYHLRD